MGSEAWFVCHTRPRCEKKFSALMAAEGFEHYLALVESVRIYGKQARRFTKPLFPGYVFARVPVESKARIYQQDLLARAIPVDDEARLLRQIADVKAVIGCGYAFTLRPLLARGRAVRIVGGPLSGVEGMVDDPADPEGVVVSVDVLRQGILVRIAADDLRPLP